MFETIAVLLLLPVAVYVTVQYVRLQNKYSNAKQSLQKLEYMSELNKNIEQLARIGMWNINLEDNSVYWSDNLHRVMFGMKQRPNSWEEKTIVETVVHPDYLDLMNEAIRNCAQGVTKSFRIEYRVAPEVANTENAWHLSEGGLQFDPITGKPTHIVGIVRDITKEKHTELLAEKAQREVEKANETKKSYLSNISHETRTPLNIILGSLQILQRDDRIRKCPDLKESVILAEDCAKSLLVQITDIINLCKSDSVGLECEMNIVPVRDMIDSVVRAMSISADEKGLEITAKIDSNVPTNIIADQIRLKQILINLINNAIKFTAVGSIDLRVYQNQDKLVLAVKDTGIGIDKQYHAMIFDRFTQVDSSTTRQYDGSGIGLALCKQLVETIDGTITLHSEVGKGSEFIVEIPVKVTEERRHSVPGVSEDEIQYMEQLNVLVCEDNIVNQKIVKKLLTKLGVANIEIANNGKEGVDMLRTSGEKIDVILMDLMMPVMDGTEATKVIRKLEQDGAPLRTRKERVPIICVTANATSGTREDITLVGADLFLTKPIILSELVSALTSCK